IMAGAPFRALLENVGFIEIQQVQRQANPLDRQASIDLAAGKIDSAIDHYQQCEQLKLYRSTTVKTELINAWKKTLSDGIEQQIILAHTREQVGELNRLAREALLEKNILQSTNHKVTTTTGEIELSPGDRLLFLKNHYDLGVFNGDFATIVKIEDSIITAQLKEKTVSFDSKKYQEFSYGYAATVHKSQGTTFQRVFTYVDGFGWDRHLSYVAMTRHKTALHVFANQDRYQTLEDLKKQLSRSPIRDNAIDYPVSFANRRGFDEESTIGRALNHIAGIGHRIKDKWLYLTQYEQWTLKQKQIDRQRDKASIRQEAKQVAKFIDLHHEVGRKWSEYYRQYAPQDFSKQKDFEAIKSLTKARDKLAYELQQSKIYNNNSRMKHELNKIDLEKYAIKHRKTLEQSQQHKNLINEIIKSPEWDKLKNEDLQKNEHFSLLIRLREQIIKNQYEMRDITRLEKSFASTSHKIINHHRLSQLFQRVVPNLYGKIKVHHYKIRENRKEFEQTRES
ncbi:MAG: hypothetical protein KDH94_05735, partial [Coxiellaceae bacterium]|nr:hypothetical protein [Coxiellaceae bacterium]